MVLRCSQELLDQLSAIGIDLFTTASNHAYDFGRRGMRSTMRELETRGLTYAGLGRDLPSARAPGYDFADHPATMGDPWGLLDPPVGFKPYPCCGSTHAAIDVALDLRDQYGGDLEGIDRIEISGHPRRLAHTTNPDPDTGLAAKFSVQYCVAVSLTDGDVWLDHFDDNTVRSGTYQPVLDRVVIKEDADTFADREWAAEVVLRAGGDEYTAVIEAPFGSADRPMARGDIDRKYRRCASIGLPEDSVERSLAALYRLETTDDVRRLVDTVV